MRLWSLHPCHLDRQGLLALWREGLLALKVLQGRTKGYRHHPQLERFRATSDPVAALASYMSYVCYAAQMRGYRCDASKLPMTTWTQDLQVTDGQLAFERDHLARKLAVRSPGVVLGDVEPHPLFVVVPGPIEPWERAKVADLA